MKPRRRRCRCPACSTSPSLWALYDLDRPELKDEPFVPATHPRLSEGETPKSVFATLREGDVLVHHPYHSFATSVQRFIEQAAADPNVLAIKQTLYRTSGDSPIVNALIEAAEAGKQVVVLVEIKARFDEEANITWARSLERAGCHVVYGLVGLKTHCKTALVVRREHGVLRRYCHIGTGNYNPKTARIYEDLGILTADPRVGADLTDLFNTLTGYSRQTNYRTLHGRAARHPHRADREDPPRGPARRRGPAVRHPVQAELAGRRADHRRALRGLGGRRPGRAAHPRHLRAAARACPGLSENIRVRSIVGRFLEHSRVMSLRQRRRAGVVDRQRRPDAPQPRPPGRGAAAGLRRDRPRRAAPDLRRRRWRPDVRCWELGSDGAWTPQRRPGLPGRAAASASVSSLADAAGRVVARGRRCRLAAGAGRRRARGRRSSTGPVRRLVAAQGQARRRASTC